MDIFQALPRGRLLAPQIVFELVHKHLDAEGMHVSNPSYEGISIAYRSLLTRHITTSAPPDRYAGRT